MTNLPKAGRLVCKGKQYERITFNSSVSLMTLQNNCALETRYGKIESHMLYESFEEVTFEPKGIPYSQKLRVQRLLKNQTYEETKIDLDKRMEEIVKEIHYKVIVMYCVYLFLLSVVTLILIWFLLTYFKNKKRPTQITLLDEETRRRTTYEV